MSAVVAEADPLFGEAGKYTASWSTHDRALGTTKLAAILRQLPGLVRICLRLSWRTSRSGTATVIGCQLATGAFSAFGLLAVNGVMRALLSSGLTTDRIRAALPALIIAAAAAAANRVASAVSTGVQTWLEAAVQHEALEEMLALTSDVEIMAFDDGEFKNLVDTGKYGASWASQALNQIVGLINTLMGLIATAGVLAVLNPLLLFTLLLIVIPSGYATIRSTQTLYRSRLSMLTPNRQHRELADLLNRSSAAEEIRVHDAGTFLLSNYRRLSHQLVVEHKRVGRLRIRNGLLASAVTGVLTVLAYLEIGWLYNAGAIKLAAVGTAAYALRSGTAELRSLTYTLATVYEYGLYLKDWQTACARARELAIPVGGIPVVMAPDIIEAREASFTYPGAERPALSSVNLRIRKGQTIALVGHNGSGKTTLAKLLAGVALPTEGQICWDGRPSDTLDRRGMFARTGLLSQGFFCWPFTARANVEIGRHTRNEPEAFGLAIENAGAGFIHELPRQAGTLLSRDYEHGVKLSGGQWQKVALARSGFYRAGDVVILDEPTAALDPQAEIDVFNRIAELMEDNTVIMITHRLASVSKADYIYVLDGGRVIEEGPFDALLASGGTFSALYRLQASQYVPQSQVT